MSHSEIKSRPAPVDKSRSVFVGGLPLGVTSGDLKAHFQRLGPVSQVDLPGGHSRGKKGFAFVEFVSAASVEKTLAYPNHMVKRKKVAVRRMMDPQTASNITKEMQARKVFAWGFPASATEDSIFQWACRQGGVTRVLSPKGGIEKRGFCFIILETKADFEYFLSLKHLKFGKYPIKITQAMLRPASTEQKENTTEELDSITDKSGLMHLFQMAMLYSKTAGSLESGGSEEGLDRTPSPPFLDYISKQLLIDQKVVPQKSIPPATQPSAHLPFGRDCGGSRRGTLFSFQSSLEARRLQSSTETNYVFRLGPPQPRRGHCFF